MARQFLTRVPTRCGVCLAEVVLIQAVGFHGLVTMNPQGMTDPHVCDPRAVAAWKRRNDRLVKLRSLIASIDKNQEIDK